MTKPNVIQIGDRCRLDTSQQDALAYIVCTYGPIDAKGAAQLYTREFPGVQIPGYFGTMFRQAVDAGKIRKVARGVYAAP